MKLPQICEIFGGLVPLMRETGHLAQSGGISLGSALALGPSQICPMTVMSIQVERKVELVEITEEEV